MLIFFMLAAFLPVLFLAFLSYSESNGLLVKQAHTRLDAASNIYKTSIYDRLLLLNQALKEVSQHISGNTFSIELGMRFKDRFRHLVLRSSDNDVSTLIGTNDIKLEDRKSVV